MAAGIAATTGGETLDLDGLRNCPVQDILDMGTGDHRRTYEGNQTPTNPQADKGCIPNRCIEEQALGLGPIVQREQDAEQEAVFAA